MNSQKHGRISSALRWACFLTLLAVAMGWVAKSVLARAGRMKTADTSAQAFSTAGAGSHMEAVVRVDKVTGRDLKCTLLEKVSETTYRRARSGEAISAALTPDTSIVMGKAEDVVPGAIVQLSGTIDANRILKAAGAVILTGYVHIADDPKPTP